MSIAEVALTGVERYYGPGEVLFSTTDRKGVIRSVNDTFLRLSRFDESELVGRPHNVIRHPGMPAAVFHSLWERIGAGLPAAAYITNRAKDGGHYRTFATIVPVGDGYISVRTTVNRLDLWAPIAQAYSLTREVELGLRAAGASRTEAARKGARDLHVRLAALGYASEAELMRVLIPAEVDERRRIAPARLPSTAPGDALHSLVTPMAIIDKELAGLRAHFDAAGTLADELGATRVGLARTLAALATASAAVQSAAESVAVPALSTTARAAGEVVTQVSGTLAPLVPLLAEVQSAVRDLRSGLALSTLHSDMAMMFVSEVHDSGKAGEAAASIRSLAETVSALADGDEALRESASVYLAQVADAVDLADGPLHDLQRLLSQWRTLVMRLDVGAQVAALMPPVDTQLARGIDEMLALARLGQRCRDAAAPVSTERLRGAAYAVVVAADSLLG